jgi:hypothetical protein
MNEGGRQLPGILLGANLDREMSARLRRALPVNMTGANAADK